MKSLKLLKQIETIPIDEKYKVKNNEDILNELHKRETSDGFIEATMATEIGLTALFENRNIPDNLFKAYEASFNNSGMSLYEHYQSIAEKGDKPLLGFINNLKGKYFEFELPEQLKDIYPGYDFEIAMDPTQPIWDIKAINIEDAEEFLIQAKMWGENGSSTLKSIMDSNPDILFATSNEIRDKILESSPELAEQFLSVDISNYDFTEDVERNLETLSSNLGIDLPDEIGSILPYITEIVLGVRLILDLIKVQIDFKDIDANDKTKISALKAILLFSRFGITTVCAEVGALAGGTVAGVIPGIGNVLGGAVGGISGAIAAGKLNKKLKPNMLEFALKLVGLEEEDMFYFNNKNRIDDLAMSYKGITI